MQPELFPEIPNEQKPKRFSLPIFPGRFIRFRVAYEDAIFGILSLVLLLLAGYCIGVERGKGMTPLLLMAEPTQGLASAASAVHWVSGESARPVEQRVAPVIPAALSVPPEKTGPAGEAAGAFCIQLASYIGMQAAQQEAQRLRRQGVQTRLVQQRKYVELRAVGFRTRSEANATLGRLRKTYRDAFIKRLSSEVR